MKVVIDSTVTRAKQNDGSWATFGGSRFLVGHMNSLKFQRVLTRLQAPHRNKIQKGTLDPAEARTIMCKAMSLGLIYDWADVVNSKGEEVPFNPENCELMLSNNDDVREFLMEYSQDLANYREDEVTDEGKR